MEQREALVDLLLLILAVLRKARVEDVGQQQLTFAWAGWNRDQAAIADEGPDHLLQFREAAGFVVHRSDLDTRTLG